VHAQCVLVCECCACTCVHVVHVHKKISCACTKCIGACMLSMYIQKILVHAHYV
jgi:hypothetical protein